ncbi:MAG: LysM peptidoglycan-binding domain-containing protein [Cryobacterium sp.]|nr:LysM peptidoglycan-binding domain-containing protein [Cryobacterium sp.]
MNATVTPLSRPRSGRSRLRLTARGRAVFATLAALPIVIAMFVFSLNGGGANATADLATGDFEYVTVMAGQSLWQLAVELEPGADPRDVIYDVLQLNQLSSSEVYAGQRLAIPAAYSSKD